MQVPSWIGPALAGAAVGAALLAVAGFGVAGWVTASTASTAVREARTQLIAKLCVNKFAADPDAAANFAMLKEAKSWNRDEIIEKGGWASFPGVDQGILGVAYVCAKQLAAMDNLPSAETVGAVGENS